MDEINQLRKARYRLSVKLVAAEDGSLAFIRRKRYGFTAPELAAALGVSNQSANNRCTKLMNEGLLRRDRETIKGGGRRFRYYANDALLRRGE